MAVGDTATSVVNQAIQLIGNNQPLVTGVAPNFDSSPSGKIAAQIYNPCVATVQREFGWDASRNIISLVLSGNPAPRLFAFEYKYPPNGIQVWQLVPADDTDPNDPLPVNFITANAVVGGVQARVIQTDLANAIAVYNNNPSEGVWDASFREAVVRLLASEFAMAIAGKPDLSRATLESGSAFESIAELRRD